MGRFTDVMRRFCRQHQGEVISRIAHVESVQAAHGALLRETVTSLAAITRVLKTMDKNLDQISADIPALLGGVSSAVSRINDLSEQLKNTGADDPRAAQLHDQIVAATKSINDALAPLSPPASAGGDSAAVPAGTSGGTATSTSAPPAAGTAPNTSAPVAAGTGTDASGAPVAPTNTASGTTTP